MLSKDERLDLTFISSAEREPATRAGPRDPYRSVPDFLKLPNDLYLGEVAGVAVNSKGHIFVFSRGDTSGPAYGAAAAQLLEFDRNGDFIREIGHHLYAWSFAHSVKFDRDDNIWVADKGSDMVIKFNPEGRVSMVFAANRKPPTKAPHRCVISDHPCRRWMGGFAK